MVWCLFLRLQNLARRTHAELPVYRVKDQKVGEGTYAVVYKGKNSQGSLITSTPFETSLLGREAAIGRKVAIKKIKVGQFKDGLDMSAIREVKYLRELKHQNVIEVSFPLRFNASMLNSCAPATGRVFLKKEPESCPRVS